MWQEPIGSIRHLRGVACKSITVSIAMDWENYTSEHTTIEAKSTKASNTAFEYCDAAWQRINEVEGCVRHG